MAGEESGLRHTAGTVEVSIVIPAKNEEQHVGVLVAELRSRYPEYEIVVVNDGSTDATAARASASGARVVTHVYSKGNGAAIKSGARVASGQILVFMDADGQHRPEEVAKLLGRMAQGYDMVVGSRSWESQAGFSRGVANRVFNRMASWIIGQRVEDLTSGFRVADAGKFREFLYLLPNGFSYPTTITMAFFRTGNSVGYEPITVLPRIGKSHINVLRDGLKFLLIIFRVGTLYSPLRIFFPIAATQLLLGLGYYLYTFTTAGRFTNMSALMLTGALITFLFGLLSEQITALLYRHEERK